MRFGEGLQARAWGSFLHWAGLEKIGDDLGGRQRLRLCLVIVGPAICANYVRPVRDWLYRHLPIEVLLLRLTPRGSGWYLVPRRQAALHASIRFDLPVHPGDFLRVIGGELVAIGLLDEENFRSEFWFVDEIDRPDPPSPVKLARHH
jgi:hypothetical protein